jgi:hypothetical protein
VVAKPVRLFIDILAILCLISCQLFSSITRNGVSPSVTGTDTPAAFYQTSTPVPGPDFTEFLPTPLITSIPNTAVTFSDVKNVDHEGQAFIQDSLARINLTVEIVDQATQQPIPTAQVQYISDGSSYVVIALDTEKKHFPSGLSGSINTGAAFVPVSYRYTSPQSKMEMGFDVFLQGDWTDVGITLELIEIENKISTFTDLVQFLSDLPSLEQRSLFYTDVCMTGPQMANLFGFTTGAAEIFIGILLPVSGAALAARYGTQEGYMLAAMLALSQHVSVEDAKEYLNSQPGSYWVRFYRFGLPFDILATDITGMCSTPAEVAETPIPAPVVTPTQAAMENEHQTAQIGNFKPTYLTFNPMVWQADLAVSASDSPVGEEIYVLHHKNYGCSLQDNLGFGPPASWEFRTYEKQIGDHTYLVEEWTDTNTGDPVLVVYAYPATLSDIFLRVELSIDDHPDECIRDAETVIKLSEEDLTTP